MLSIGEKDVQIFAMNAKRAGWGSTPDRVEFFSEASEILRIYDFEMSR